MASLQHPSVFRAHDDARPELAVDAQLSLALQICDSLITRMYRERLQPLGLTHPQYLVLLVLWEQPAATMGDLRRTLRLDTGAMTPLVKRMEAAGLLKRRRDVADERRVFVDLTETGWALRDQVAAVTRDVERRLPLSPGQLADLRATLQQLNAAILAGGRPEDQDAPQQPLVATV